MLSSLLKYIVPSFLQRFDRYLLVNYPHLWRTRGHYFAFYCAISMILLFSAGYFYPQTLYDLVATNHSFHTNLPFYVTCISAFLSIGVIFGIWYQIQKFQYNRLKWGHFLTEMSIFAFSATLLWSAVFAFFIGYEYRTAYHLEKNIEPNRQWLKDHSFFKAGYVSHYQLNKLDDLSSYFKQGDTLLSKMEARHRILREQGFFKDQHENDYYRNDRFEYYEYLTPPAYKLFPAAYTTASKYYQDILWKDLRLEASQKPFFKGGENGEIPNTSDFMGKTLPYLSSSAYGELIDYIHPKWSPTVDASRRHQRFWQDVFEKKMAQQAFLDKLSASETKLYLDYLKYLRNSMLDKVYTMPKLEKIVFNLLEKQFRGKRRVEIGLAATDDYNGYKSSLLMDSLDLLVAEKAILFLKPLPAKTKTLYAAYATSDYEKIYYTHHESDMAICKTKSLDYLKKQVSTLQDSIIYFDTYFSKTLTDITPIFREAYCKYFVDKYSKADYDRFTNILESNGFPHKSTYSSSRTRQLFLLQQGEILEKALEQSSGRKVGFKELRLVLYSFFSLMCCILAAIVFYIMTISNGVQFWAGIFIGGVCMAFVTFMLNIWGFREKQTIPMILIGIHIVLFIGLILKLLFSKYQWQNARVIVNSILFSGVISVGLASILLLQYVHELRRAEPNYVYHYDLRGDLFLFANVIAVAILIYLIITYLFKRHLTLPKKH